ncbi:MAG: hypothetical protein CSA05_03460 [Bacteroidia bacterium]|nr:MAG: hypothetical protein CSA05_03460 [Bacteroidia bacterium]
MQSVKRYCVQKHGPRMLFEASVTVLKDEKKYLPFYDLPRKPISSVAIGANEINEFQKYLQYYTDVKNYALAGQSSETVFQLLAHELEKSSLVVVSLHALSADAEQHFGLTEQAMNFVDTLAAKTNVMLVVFGNPYVLKEMKSLKDIKTIVLSYNDSQTAREVAAQVLFGGISAKGALPININTDIFSGIAINTPQIRMKYSIPQEVEMCEETMARIDSIALDGIAKKAMPGCQILIAKDGVVFYHKAFGYHTYKKKNKVKTTDIYDIASITKIAATVPSLMKLTDERKFDVDKEMGEYLPDLKSTNKENIVIKTALAHYAKIAGWFPFYPMTYKKKQPNVLNEELCSKQKSDKYPLQVADNLFITQGFRDTILNKIYDSRLKRKKKYKYSDLTFYMLREMIEEITKMPIDVYTKTYFYEPIGCTTMGYNPLERFPRKRIVPTEEDTYFRKQLVHGYVHDFGAALCGGVGGHAGLFSNANDLAKLMQMYLQGGVYARKKYLEEKTIKKFTKRPFKAKKNRRALGFDRPLYHYENKAFEIPDESYGHTGFTGTIAWVDPKSKLVYVFLSNRIHPSIKNRKLIDMNIRSKIHRLVYEAMIQPEAEHLADKSKKK